MARRRSGVQRASIGKRHDLFGHKVKTVKYGRKKRKYVNANRLNFIGSHVAIFSNKEDMLNKATIKDNGHWKMKTAADYTLTDSDISEGLVLGTDDFEEWVKAKYYQAKFLTEESIACKEQDWTLPVDWDMCKWLEDPQLPISSYYMDRGHNTYLALVDMGWGYIKLSVSSNILTSIIFGPADKVEETLVGLGKQFAKSEVFIEWVISADDRSISLPLNYKKAYPSFYPWLEKPIEQYFNEYLESDACVLILIGPPGTGKTTFLKNLIDHTKSSALLTYDPKILSNDYFFSRFLSGDQSLLIMEDADNFLAARDDGNDLMHRLLNVSDGIVSLKGKKMIFSTNLPNISSIDSALIRPGRCFDVMDFRRLTGKEANAVMDEVGMSLETYGRHVDNAELTLAEIFHPGAESPKTIRTVKRFGFSE